MWKKKIQNWKICWNEHAGSGICFQTQITIIIIKDNQKFNKNSSMHVPRISRELKNGHLYL